MGWISIVANDIVTSDTHVQAEEVKPTGDHAQQAIQMEEAPSKTQPRMDSRELASTGRSARYLEIGARESFRKEGKTYQEKVALA